MFKKITPLLLLIVAFYTKGFGQAPTIEYKLPGSFTVGVPFTAITPAVNGVAITGYTIKPLFPPASGLTFNATTGAIGGPANAVLQPTTFTVTGNSANGPALFTFNLSVVPKNVYSPSGGYFLVDAPITTMRPVNGDTLNTVYTGDLPEGLRLNSKNGEITGAMTKATSSAPFTITGTYVDKTPTTYIVNIAGAPDKDVASTPPTLRFVGQGNIQQSLNTGAKVAANTGIGVVYRQNSSKRYGLLHSIEIDFSINVASTVDTIKSINNASNVVTNREDFGNSVLLPLNSGQAFAFNFKGYLTERGGEKGKGNYRRNGAPRALGGVISGFNISLAGSNRNWEFVDVNPDAATTRVKTSLLSFYVGPFFEFITPNKENKYGENASITLGLGYSGRWILGDVRQTTQTEFRNKLLGSEENYFGGPELTLGLRFYNIKAEVHLPFLSNKAGVPGLSGTHLTTFIGFSGGFPIDLNKSSNDTNK
jgi:hypothetical protein